MVNSLIGLIGADHSTVEEPALVLSLDHDLPQLAETEWMELTGTLPVMTVAPAATTVAPAVMAMASPAPTEAQAEAALAPAATAMTPAATAPTKALRGQGQPRRKPPPKPGSSGRPSAASRGNRSW